MPEFVTQYNKKNKSVSLEFTKPSLTEQMYKQECDVNWIVNNFVRTGTLPQPKQLSYIDCTTVQDYQSAQLLLADCKSAFYDLPSKERDKFRTVENFLEFITNPANLRESYENGYIDRSTIDIKDVYPERYRKVDDFSTPSNNTTGVDSSATSTPSSSSGDAVPQDS